jgi:LSD1 subclass zinc finger protein
MAVQVVCPNLRCRKILSVPEETRGKQVRCQHCETTFRVPEARKPAVVAQAKK